MDSEKLKQDLRRDEGLKLKPYRCSAGKLTIGVGRNLEEVGLSRAEHLLEKGIRRVKAAPDRALPWWQELSEARPGQHGL